MSRSREGRAIAAALLALAAAGAFLLSRWAGAGAPAAARSDADAAAAGARNRLLAELTAGLDSARPAAPARLDVPALPPPAQLAAARFEGDPFEDRDGNLAGAAPEEISRGTSTDGGAGGVAAKLSSDFGWRVHPITKRWSFHSGMDLAVPWGTPVGAFANGRVVFAGYAGNAGLMVVLLHFNGYETRYEHLSSTEEGVVVGAALARGSGLGYVGSTGRSTAPHLHFEVRHNGEAVSPHEITPEMLETDQSRAPRQSLPGGRRADG